MIFMNSIEIFLALLPEAVLRARFERARHDHPAPTLPAMEAWLQFGQLHEPLGGRILPVFPQSRRDGPLDPGGERLKTRRACEMRPRRTADLGGCR